MEVRKPIKIEDIKKGMEFKNWKVLCDCLGWECKSSNNRKANEKELSRFCEWHKEGQRIIIDRKFRKPKDKIDGRTSMRNAIKYDFYLPYENKIFQGYYVYVHYIEDEIIYIGKGCKNRATKFDGRAYGRNDITNIEILKRFEDEDEALAYEEEMIKYYQSIGQCKYNDDAYHRGSLRDIDEERMFNKKINKEIENMFKFMI